MNMKELKAYILSGASCVTFEYNGKNCGIDPYVSKSGCFDVWFGDETFVIETIDKVFNTPLFDGKSLNEVFSSISNLE